MRWLAIAFIHLILNFTLSLSFFNDQGKTNRHTQTFPPLSSEIGHSKRSFRLQLSSADALQHTVSLITTNLEVVGVKTAACSSSFDFNKFAIAGAFAGGCRALSRAFTYPFDTIKTLEQSDSVLRPKKVDYFRGLFLSVLSNIPANAVFFVTYYYFDQIFYCSTLEKLSASNEFVEKMTISCIATLPQNAFKIPSEVIKQRAQLQPDLPIMTIVDETVNGNKGWLGLYSGSGAQLLRELPYNAFQMAIYDIINEQSWLVAQHYDKEVLAAFLGLFAASMAAVLTQPADVVKTKIMTSKPSAGNHFLVACKEVWLNEGLKGFFAGLIPRLLIVSIGGMVYFLAAAFVEDYLTT